MKILKSNVSIKLIDGNKIVIWLKLEVKNEELNVKVMKVENMEEEIMDELVDCLICG